MTQDSAPNDPEEAGGQAKETVSGHGPAVEKGKRFKLLGRVLPLVILLVGLAVIYFSGAYRYLSLETLQEQREVLTGAVAERPVISMLVYVVLYTAVTALMVPGALWVTIAGGFLFGLVAGLIATVFSATLGATILFLAARTSFGNSLRARTGPFLERLRAGFEENALSVMFAMRFMPAVPFPIANIAPALLGARLRDFLLTTAIGITPGAAAYTWIGSGLGASFDKGVIPDLTTFAANLSPAFVLLALVALLPIAYKYFMRARKANG